MDVDLKELHDVHLQLHDVQKTLQRGPKQIARHQQAFEKRQQELQDAKQHLKDLQHTASVKNQDLQVLESKIVDLNVKLNAAKTNQEFDVFQRQIEADTTAKEVAEVEILAKFAADNPHTCPIPHDNCLHLKGTCLGQRT